MGNSVRRSAKLTVMKAGVVVSEHWLADAALIVGRHPNSEVQVHDLGISARHARISPVMGGVFLEDLNSTNGCKVNGMPVRRRILADGDLIEAGDHIIRFEHAEEANAEVAKTLMVRPLSRSQAAPQAQPTAAARGAARLVVLNGRARQRVLPLRKSLVTLGRSGRQVAVISRRPEGYYLTHVGSGRRRGFPLVNGRLIGPYAHRLNHGDEIRLDDMRLRFIDST